MNRSVVPCSLSPIKSPLPYSTSFARAAFLSKGTRSSRDALPSRSRLINTRRRDLTTVKEVSPFPSPSPHALLQVSVTGSVDSSYNEATKDTPELLEGAELPQSTNGSVAVVELLPSSQETAASDNGVDVNSWVDPCAAGQVETCAAVSDADATASLLEDKWSKRKTYNALQVTHRLPPLIKICDSWGAAPRGR